MRHTTYKQVMPGVYQIIPCSCDQCMNGQAQDQQFKNFLERLNKAYEEFYGKPSPSYEEYKRKASNRADGTILLQE